MPDNSIERARDFVRNLNTGSISQNFTDQGKEMMYRLMAAFYESEQEWIPVGEGSPETVEPGEPKSYDVTVVLDDKIVTRSDLWTSKGWNRWGDNLLAWRERPTAYQAPDEGEKFISKPIVFPVYCDVDMGFLMDARHRVLCEFGKQGEVEQADADASRIVEILNRAENQVDRQPDCD